MSEDTQYPITEKGGNLRAGDVIEGQLLVLTNPKPETDEKAIAAFKLQLEDQGKPVTPEEDASGYVKFAATDTQERYIVIIPAATDVNVTAQDQDAAVTMVKRQLRTSAAQSLRALRGSGGGEAAFSLWAGGDYLSVHILVNDEGENVLFSDGSANEPEDWTLEVDDIIQASEKLRADLRATVQAQHEAEQRAAAERAAAEAFGDWPANGGQLL